jgi:carboxyl-terminal processing protease
LALLLASVPDGPDAIGQTIAPRVDYAGAFLELYTTLGRRYPAFELKGIDWAAVGERLVPRSHEVQDDHAFGLLCLELVAALEDTHARLLDGTASVPVPPLPRWDPGFACLADDRGRAVVFHVDPAGPAEANGVRPGVEIVSVNGVPAGTLLKERMELLRRYYGFSSERQLRSEVLRSFARQKDRHVPVTVKVRDLDGRTHELSMPATLGRRYIPGRPVFIDGVREYADVSWTRLDDGIGYVSVRRIRERLIESLDEAVAELRDSRGLVVDVRGNSGGGFDAGRSHLNFALDRDGEEPRRPRYRGPIALLIDARCVSAGEGWASWFVARGRATLFGEATAGASARKAVHELANGLYRVRFPVKMYKGFLDRPIERRGLEPDVPIKPNARDLAFGRDTVLDAARRHLLELEEDAP